MGEEFRNVFICYSRVDEAYATSVYHLLQKRNYDVFLDQVNNFPGQEWEPQTLSALRNANFIVIVLTEGSAERMGYAMKEIKEALHLHKHDRLSRRMICPVRVKDAPLPDGLGRFNWAAFSIHGLDSMADSFDLQCMTWEGELSQEAWVPAPALRREEMLILAALTALLVVLLLLRML